ncbi:hypothetical protein GTE61_004905 [Salmonella enterica subsp. enterica]|nr:hypothetical protein [Salmonella enterica subsp. enterica]EDX0932858.1 hypothetical protein [Salmonella enterica subsp. enterica]
MADMNANTVTRVVDQDVLEAASISADYAHSIAVLITEQRDFHKLPATQREALRALVNFTYDAKNAISDLMR